MSDDYNYDRTAGRSLNLQHKTIWQIKVQWAQDLITGVSEMAAKLPGRTTIQNYGGNAPTLKIDGHDSSDLEWEMVAQLTWRGENLYAEVELKHPMRGRKGEDDTFSESSEGMEIMSWMVSTMKTLLGAR